MVRRKQKYYKIKVKKGICLYDIHYPNHSEASVDIAFEFVNDFQPDILVYAGDQMDMESICFYSRNKPKLTEGKRLYDEYQGFQKDILDKFESVIPKECEKYFMVGNHEYRIDRLIETDTQHQGFIEIEKNLDLKDYTIIPFNEILKIGKMNLIHGIYHTKYHSAKHLDVYSDNIIYGHVHSPQVFTKITPIQNLPQQGISVGCLSNKNPDYMKGTPNRWVNGFMYFYLLEDGTFYYYLPTIINDMCVIQNKIYKYRKHRGIRVERIS